MMEPTVPVALPETVERQNENANVIRLHAKLVKSARSWGTWLLVLGVLQLVASNLLEPTFGVLLLIVGVLSFVFTHPALFVVYATTLAWAAVSNILSALVGGQVQWGIFALVQVYMAYSTLREYKTYRQNEVAYRQMLQAEGVSDAQERVPVQVFPIGGCALAVGGALLLVATFTALIYLGATQPDTEPSAWINWLFGLAQGFAILAVGLSAASLASQFRHRVLSILALAGSALTVLIFILLTLG